MRVQRGAAYGLASFLLLAQSPADAELVVKSHNSRQYWIIRTDTLNHLRGANQNERLNSVEFATAYGPHDVGANTVHQTKRGAQYSVFPRCGPRMKRNPARPDGRGPSVWVDC